MRESQEMMIREELKEKNKSLTSLEEGKGRQSLINRNVLKRCVSKRDEQSITVKSKDRAISKVHNFYGFCGAWIIDSFIPSCENKKCFLLCFRRRKHSQHVVVINKCVGHYFLDSLMHTVA